MLLRYVVSNFKSIGHKIGFSMFPTKENLDERYLTKITTRVGEWNVLRRGAFFGPNASGKTVFIQSMHYARNFIVEGKKSGKNTGVEQFGGNIEELHQLTTFQFMLYVDGEVYDYGFALDRNRVHEEWLMILGNNGFQKMFERQTNKEGKTEIQITSKFGKKDSKQRKLVEILKESMQENQKNQLFLYKLYDNGVKKVENIVKWFKNIQIIYPTTKVQELPVRVKLNDEFKDFLSKKLDEMDTGVQEIFTSSDEMELRKVAKKMDIPEEIVAEIEQIEKGVISFKGEYFIFSEKGNNTVLMQLKFKHLLNHVECDFEIEQESDGTQRLLDLLPMLFQVSNNSDSIYFVDELDRSLHTKLSKYLLTKFIEESDNCRSQIIFTAHDVNLINLDDFRQEEIWFIEKNSLGESKIKPFSDFEIKKGQNLLQDYLNGRFGAVPVIRRSGNGADK